MPIGIRIGSRIGLGVGLQMAAARSGAVTAPLVDIWGVGYGQSNMIGEADASATKTDQGYGAFVSDPTIVQRLLYAQALSGSGAQTFIDSGTTGGIAYGAPGVANVGAWLRMSKALKLYGGYSKVGFSLAGAVLGASLRRNLMPGAADGRGIYAAHIARAIADAVIMGRAPAFWPYIQGETDSTDTTDAAAYQTNLAALIAADRAALGAPNMLAVIVQLNTGMTGSTFNSVVRAAQAAYVASDPFSVLVNVDDIPMAISGIHYDANGLADIGDREAFAVLRALRPGERFSLGAGPAPWLQYAAAGATSTTTPDTAIPRSGPSAEDGDWEYLVCCSYSVATTITLTTAAGFTPVGTQFESVFSTAHRTMAVFERPVTTAILLANSGRMPAPVVDSATADKNASRIFGVRGPNKWTVSPTGTTTTAVNNGNTTALTFAGGSTSTANNLLLIPVVSTGAAQAIASVPAGFTVQWDSRYNPGSGVVHMGLITGTVAAAGAYGSTAITFAAAGVNAGMLIQVKP